MVKDTGQNQVDTLRTEHVGVIMGSKSDWSVMSAVCQTFKMLRIPHKAEIVSAHRTPDKMFAYAETAESRGLVAIIAGAGGAAHLPGMIAAKTIVPVFGVPIESKSLKGLDSLLSIAQMPKGVPVASFAIGEPGAINAALFVAAILARQDEKIAKRLLRFRTNQRVKVSSINLPRSIWPKARKSQP